MSKPKVNDKEAFVKEPYRSILNLLIAYKDEKGFEQKDLRYFLVKNHDKENLRKGTYKGLEYKYDKIADSLYKNDVVTKGCISIKSGRNRLNNALKTLIDLGIIFKVSEGKKTLYKIKKNYILLGERIMSKRILDSYSLDLITQLNSSHLNVQRTHILYGFPSKMYDSLPQKYKDKIQDSIDEINRILSYIQIFVKTRFLLKELKKILREKAKEFDGSEEFKKAWFKEEFAKIFTYVLFYRYGRSDESYPIWYYLLMFDEEESKPSEEDEDGDYVFLEYSEKGYRCDYFKGWNLSPKEMKEFEKVAKEVILNKVMIDESDWAYEIGNLTYLSYSFGGVLKHGQSVLPDNLVDLIYL